MNNKQVAHLWANKSKQSASGSHFYFEGDTIYSYGRHFPIARHAIHKGKPCVLFTTDDYSSSTSRHKSYVRNAIASGIPILYVQRIGEGKVTSEQIKESKAYDAQVAKDEVARQAKWEKRNAKLLSEYPEKLAKWRNGELSSLPHIEGAKTALRLSPDASRIQTSRGAEISSVFARRAWPILKDASSLKLPDFEWGNFKGIHLVESTLRVGCHQIPMDEVKLIAQKLGLN